MTAPFVVDIQAGAGVVPSDDSTTLKVRVKVDVGLKYQAVKVSTLSVASPSKISIVAVIDEVTISISTILKELEATALLGSLRVPITVIE